METGSILLFVGIIVGSCIIGGAIHSGLIQIANAMKQSSKTT
ncbi:hypothetical protein [Lentilitoribacter sp. EG35]